jgi:precorrin-2 methylase
MLTLSLIGIGCGDPEQLTLAAIRAINAADLVLIPRKGADKSDLAELRRTICSQVISGDRPRLVEFDLGSINGTMPSPQHGRRRLPPISARKGVSRS